MGSQLRPHIVWFGEMVPMIETAARIAMQADYFAVIGTSMLVYPAASLIHYVPADCPKYIIDPNMPLIQDSDYLYKIEKPATTGTQDLYDMLTKDL